MRLRHLSFLLPLLPVVLIARQAASMTLTSTDIRAGGAIPAPQIYPRCGGQNISPALAWRGQPGHTMSFVLTMIDQDVKPAQWSHWIVVDLPPTTTSLSRGASTLPGGAHAVVSNFGDAAYAGPCPPRGTGIHHYQISVWAMPAATTKIGDDTKATDMTATLSCAALDHASLTGSVEAPK